MLTRSAFYMYIHVMETASAASEHPRTKGIVPAARLNSVDIVRGLAMIIMALDHTRDFLSSALFDPTDLSKTNPLLFFTR